MSKHNKEKDLAYVRTPRGLAMKIHKSQVSASNNKPFKKPLYSSLELYEWLISQSNWDCLYSDWVDSGYIKELIPSIDRIDSLIGYSFDNIQLLTWSENRLKGYKENGLLQGNSIRQLSLDGTEIKIFTSAREASRITGIHRGSILQVCKGERNSAGGYRWIK